MHITRTEMVSPESDEEGIYQSQLVSSALSGQGPKIDWCNPLLNGSQGISNLVIWPPLSPHPWEICSNVYKNEPQTLSTIVHVHIQRNTSDGHFFWSATGTRIRVPLQCPSDWAAMSEWNLQHFHSAIIGGK